MAPEGTLPNGSFTGALRLGAAALALAAVIGPMGTVITFMVARVNANESRLQAHLEGDGHQHIQRRRGAQADEQHVLGVLDPDDRQLCYRRLGLEHRWHHRLGQGADRLVSADDWLGACVRYRLDAHVRDDDMNIRQRIHLTAGAQIPAPPAGEAYLVTAAGKLIITAAGQYITVPE